jgi:serine/threonine-protein kinase HipA
MKATREISVYADWLAGEAPAFVGVLTAIPSKGKEVFSFEYDSGWLRSDAVFSIDPEMQLYKGRYFPREEKPNFGVFLDSSPDRWGRVLMDRREAYMARLQGRKPVPLLESDYLLGVYDGHRMGALRFKVEENGNFLNDDIKMAAPPWTTLRDLEFASMKLEEDNVDDKDYSKWIDLLIAPGSSLGGARPKAGVIDAEGNLWIAKFPSIKDGKDIGAWEMVAHKLAIGCGINAPEATLKKFNNSYHTFITKRFDRNTKGGRIHFASAMTMLGYMDGAGADTGVSYLELVEFITRYGSDANADLEELWRRIVFNISIRNTDDHLRNHGFLLSDKGWKLSPAYDINPNEFGVGLSLNISETDNALDINLALEVAGFFRLKNEKAKEILAEVEKSVRGWRTIAKSIGITKGAQDRMAIAFE